MITPLRAVIFGCDGTLVETARPACRPAWPPA